PAAVVLHVKPAGRAWVGGDLVHALAELRVRIGHEARAHALVRRRECVAPILAQVVAAGRDADVHSLSVAQDGMHAKSTIAGMPLPRVLVVADARNHLPGIATVAASEQRCRLDAAPQVFLAVARFERPDVRKRASVVLGKGRSRLRLLELLAD